MTKKEKKGRINKSRYRTKYAIGGMYNDNTVQSAGQGNVGSTSHTVFEESNPEILKQKLKFLEDKKNQLKASSQNMANTIQSEEEQSKIDVQNAALEEQQKTDAVGATIGSTIKTTQEAADAGVLGEKIKEKGKDKLKAGKQGTVGAMHAYKAQRAMNLATKATAGNAAGMNLITDAAAATKAVKALPEGAQIMSSAKTGKTIVVDAGGNVISGTGSSLGAGIASAAKNPNVLAAAANVGGKVIKHFSDDDDATTWTAGEATGDILGTAGEYAGYGAMLTSWLGPGAGIGAAVGGIIGAGVGIYKGLTGRNKARKEEREAKRKRDAKVQKYNTEVKEEYGSAIAAARAGEVAQKTYSGYDLGRNVVAKYGGARYKNGGMRLGTPRCGHAS